MATKRKYPVGIQSFESIRRDGYLYIDKTPLIYKMITEGKPYFLSRPRRFGKSLLLSTLAAVFEGRRELFEAFTTEQGIEQPQLFIARSDWKWEKYPVLRFDFSAGDLQAIEQLDELIDVTLSGYENQYGITPPSDGANVRMTNLLRKLHEQTGKRVVVLVDEYDNFILHALGDKEKMEAARHRFQNVFGPLKAEDDHLQFAFITGISKFSQMGIFSKLNNLNNISMQNAYETLCGISEEELTTTLHIDIEMLAEENDLTYDEQLQELKHMYDGYHFSRKQTDTYNPFSLVNALSSKQVDAYWFDRGTSSALFEMLAKMPQLDMAALEGRNCTPSAFDLPLESFDDPLPVLYQSGYLTIKSYRRDRDMYTLGFPNQEVSKGFAECLYRHVTNSRGDSQQRSELLEAYYDFRDSDDLPAFIDAIKTFFAGVLAPPKLGGYRGLNKGNTDDGSDPQPPNLGGFDALLYTLLVAFGADVRAEEPSAKGRSDLTLFMPKGIYIMELKYDDSVDAALDQIDRKGYADKYVLDGRPVIKVGIAFSSAERNITDWKADS